MATEVGQMRPHGSALSAPPVNEPVERHSSQVPTTCPRKLDSTWAVRSAGRTMNSPVVKVLPTLSDLRSCTVIKNLRLMNLAHVAAVMHATSRCCGQSAPDAAKNRSYAENPSRSAVNWIIARIMALASDHNLGSAQPISC
jgi:hypothetical protein